MSETTPIPAEVIPTVVVDAPIPSVGDRTIVTVTYGLFLASFIFGFTALIGIILAHIKSADEKDPVLASHFSYLKRSFWWGTLWLTIGLILTVSIYLSVIGIPALIAASVWFLYRNIKGLLRLNDRKPI